MDKKFIPLMEYDPEKKAIIEPSKLFKKQDVPERCILCFFYGIIKKWAEEGKLTKIAKITVVERDTWMYKMEVDGEEIAIFHPGVGGALSAMHFEFAIAVGCKTFLSIGSGGVLDSRLKVGKLILVDSAIRDEGLSFHYEPPSRTISADAETLKKLKSEMNRRNIVYETGKTWTTDAICRETPDKIKLRSLEGAIIVEMEAAALIAVAKFRNVPLGYLVYCGDDVSGKDWDARKEIDRYPIRERALILATELILAI
ncbi:MAG: nucleoside phosphorylase [Promethearchaeota archaeon]